VREGGTLRELRGKLVRGGQQRGVLVQRVEEAPGVALARGHGAAGEQQLARASLANHARQQGAGAHVGAGEAHAGEEECHRGLRRAQAQVGSQRHHRAGAGANAVERGHDGLRAGAHGAHQRTRHAGEGQQLGHGHLGERADDFVHVATGAEVIARAGEHHRLDVGAFLQGQEPVAQFCVRVEGQRVLALGAVERDGGHTAVHAECEVTGACIGHGGVLAAHGVVVGDGVLHSSIRWLMSS